MNRQFHISNSASGRPPSRQTIFCDGSADGTYRPGVDLELSHWVPNRTPTAFRADTSTEICFRFLDNPGDGEWDLIVNNHCDIDGMLSVFTLANPDFALQHRRTMIEAAGIGDFWCWGERPAQELFQGLTLLMNRLESEGASAQLIYEQCFQAARSLLVDGAVLDDASQSGLNELDRSVELIDSQKVARTIHHDRFVHYHIPETIAETNLDRALHVPSFNAPFSSDCLLWPQARARQDKEKIQLISVESHNRCYYDLWYPGYVWADTPNCWRPPGLSFAGSTNGYYYGHEPLNDAVDELRALETADGKWVVPTKVSFAESIPGRGFPVLLSFMTDRQLPAISSLKPEVVAPNLAQAFQGQ